MFPKIIYFALLAVFLSGARSQVLDSPSACSYSYTIEQTEVTSWLQGDIPAFLYYITIKNTGSAPFSPFFIFSLASNEAIGISESYNLIEYGYTDPDRLPISISPFLTDLVVAPGSSWTGTSYVIEGGSASLVLYNDSCPVAPAVTTTSGSASSTTTTSSSSTSTSTSTTGTSSPSGCAVSATITARSGSSWTDSNGKLNTLYDISVINTGTCDVIAVQLAFTIANPSSTITQQWNLDSSFNVQGISGGIQAGSSYPGPGLVLTGGGGISVSVASKSCNC